MAEQERVEPLLHPLAVIEQVAAGADQVPDRLLRRGRDPDRGQHPGAQREGQADCVATVGLDPVRGALRDQRRRDHLARHPHRGNEPVQLVTRRPGLVADRQHPAVAELPEQPPHRFLVVRDPVDGRDLPARPQHPAHDLPHRGIHSHVDRLRPGWQTSHDGWLPSACGSVLLAGIPAHQRRTIHDISQETRSNRASTGRTTEPGRFMLTYEVVMGRCHAANVINHLRTRYDQSMF